VRTPRGLACTNATARAQAVRDNPYDEVQVGARTLHGAHDDASLRAWCVNMHATHFPNDVGKVRLLEKSRFCLDKMETVRKLHRTTLDDDVALLERSPSTPLIYRVARKKILAGNIARMKRLVAELEAVQHAATAATAATAAATEL